MTPERRQEIGGHKVEEYIWNWKAVVYVDNLATEETFEAACARLEVERDESPEGKLQNVLHGMVRVAEAMREEREKVNLPPEEHAEKEEKPCKKA